MVGVVKGGGGSGGMDAKQKRSSEAERTGFFFSF